MRKTLFLVTLLFPLLLMDACSLTPPKDPQDVNSKLQRVEDYSGKKELATFAGGCFWCTESDFEKLNGVIAAISGYAGGEEENPTYEEVSAHETGHREAVQVTFDPDVVSYKDIVTYFFHHIDPTDDGGQFVDRGFQYTSAIFSHSDAQKKTAEEVKEELDASGVFDKPIVTAIVPYTSFYPAEDYHQDYYKNNPIRYQFYRHGSGRDQFLEETWKE